MNYIEIYRLDVLNLPAEIAYAHNMLLGLAPPAPTPSLAPTLTPPPTPTPSPAPTSPPAAVPQAPTGLQLQH